MCKKAGLGGGGRAAGPALVPLAVRHRSCALNRLQLVCTMSRREFYGNAQLQLISSFGGQAACHRCKAKMAAARLRVPCLCLCPADGQQSHAM